MIGQLAIQREPLKNKYIHGGKRARKLMSKLPFQFL